MKLYHSECGNQVEASNSKLAVRVVDFQFSGKSIEVSLLDLIPVKGGKITFSCSACKKDLEETDLTMPCSRCGTAIPITEVYELEPEFFCMCKNCLTKIVKLKHKDETVDMSKYKPVSYHIK